MEGEAFYGQAQAWVLLCLVLVEKVAQHVLRVQRVDQPAGNVIFPKHRRGPCLFSKLLGQFWSRLMWIGDTNKLSSINYFSADSLHFFENPDPIQHLFINSFGNDLKIILQIRKKPAPDPACTHQVSQFKHANFSYQSDITMLFFYLKK